MGTSGFSNAPVTTALVGWVLVATAAVSAWGWHAPLRIGNDTVVQKLQLWRLLSSQLAFPSVGDAVVASILLYSCRHCERQLGSSKYFMHIVFAFLLTAALELGVLVTLPLRSALTTGPYGIVCASLALYYAWVPPTMQYVVTGLDVRITRKSFVYLLAMQLLLSHGLASLVPCVVGLLAGAAYVSEALPLQNVRTPRWLEWCGSFLFAFMFLMFQGPPRPVHAADEPQGVEMQQAQFASQGRAAPALDEAAVERLMGLGFDRARVEVALAQSHNDPDVAANLLLMSA